MSNSSFLKIQTKANKAESFMRTDFKAWVLIRHVMPLKSQQSSVQNHRWISLKALFLPPTGVPVIINTWAESVVFAFKNVAYLEQSVVLCVGILSLTCRIISCTDTLLLKTSVVPKCSCKSCWTLFICSIKGFCTCTKSCCNDLMREK